MEESNRSGSLRRTSDSAYMRNLSYSSSGISRSQVEDNIESETVSEAGDIGDRAIHSNRYSENIEENGGSTVTNTISTVSPLPAEMISPLSTDAIIGDREQENKKRLPWRFDFISCLIHLAVFGILGVLTRYILQKLFGPAVAGFTSDRTILYLDLPSNMVGSFLMGWLGVVFKRDISEVSDLLAIGLMTGYLGSLTTFSGWNQKMLELSAEGHWVLVVLGYLVGLFICEYCIIFGVETAKGFKWLLWKLNTGSKHGRTSSKRNWKVNTCKRRLAVLVALVLMLGLSWGLSWTFLVREFSSGGSGAQLSLACLVAFIGVWIRWLLARLNGRGLGRTGLLKWVPFGTLIANVSAACVMAALATLKKAVRTKKCDTVATGIQLGLLGCLSTVSTFIAEFHAMRESEHPWRAYAYAAITILTSFVLGTLIYSVPVWTKAYD